MTEVKRRAYNAPVRVAQAAQTRERILTAAAIEFAEKGWSGTTIALVAARAGVTPQAVHLAVGGKATLLHRAVEITVAGATDDTPLADRPAFDDVYAEGKSARRRIEAFAIATADIYERAAQLFIVLQEAARSDQAVAELAEAGGRHRLANHLQLAELLLPESGAEVARDLADVIWVLAGPGVFVDLVHRRGWSPERYSGWLVTSLLDAVARAKRAD